MDSQHNKSEFRNKSLNQDLGIVLDKGEATCIETQHMFWFRNKIKKSFDYTLLSGGLMISFFAKISFFN